MRHLITKEFFINTTKLNTRPILFYGQPTVTATEVVKGQTDSTQTQVQSTETITGSVEIDVNVSNVEQRDEVLT